MVEIILNLMKTLIIVSKLNISTCVLAPAASLTIVLDKDVHIGNTANIDEIALLRPKASSS